MVGCVMAGGVLVLRGLLLGGLVLRGFLLRGRVLGSLVLGGLLLRGLFLGSFLLGSLFLGSSLLGGCGTAVADDRQNRADLDGLVLGDGLLLERARNGRRDLGVDLVGGDLEQGLVDGDLVADLLEPAGDGSLGDGRSEEHTSELKSLMRNSYAV